METLRARLQGCKIARFLSFFIADLRPGLIICNRTIDDVIVVDVVCILVLAVGKDERGPFSGIAVETQEPQSPIAQMSLVEFVALNYCLPTKQLYLELSHLFCLCLQL